MYIMHLIDVHRKVATIAFLLATMPLIEISSQSKFNNEKWIRLHKCYAATYTKFVR